MRAMWLGFAAVIVIAAIAGASLTAMQETTAERFTVGDTRP